MIRYTHAMLYHDPGGYGLTLSVAERSIGSVTVVGEYRDMTWPELLDALDAALHTLRPGWEVGEVPQPTLWDSLGADAETR